MIYILVSDPIDGIMRRIIPVSRQWIRKQTRADTVRTYYDTNLIENLFVFNHGIRTFDRDLFETSHNMAPIENSKKAIEFLKKKFGRENEEVFPMIPNKVKGSTFLEQIRFLIKSPKAVRPAKILTENEDAVLYLIARCIQGGIPSGVSWIRHAEGLDDLCAAGLYLHQIARFFKAHINWVEVIGHPDHYSKCIVTDLRNARPDAAMSIKWDFILSRARISINHLRDPVMIRFHRLRRNVTRPQQVSHEEIWESWGRTMSKRSTSVYSPIYEAMSTEKFLPAMARIGLRYRYIFTTRATVKNYFKRGLVEQFQLMPTNDNEVRYVFVYLEPITLSQDYSINQDYDRQFIVDSESYSMRLDLFEQRTGEWQISPWDQRFPGNPKDNPDWWYFETRPRGKSMVRLIKRDADIMFSLLGHNGSYKSRTIIMNLLGYSWSTYYRAINNLLDKGVLRLMYHPTTEFSGLTESVLVIIPEATAKMIKKCIRWFRNPNAFCHIRTNAKKTALVAHLRVPNARAWIIAKVIRDQLIEEGLSLENREFVSAIVTGMRYYYLAFPPRMFNDEERSWREDVY